MARRKITYRRRRPARRPSKRYSKNTSRRLGQVVTRVPQPFGRMSSFPAGDKFFTTLQYSYTYQLPNTAAAYDNYLQMNNCYDPGGAFGDLTPAGFRALCGNTGAVASGLFKRYRVHGASIDVWHINRSADPQQVTMFPSVTSVVTTNQDQARCQPLSVNKVTGANEDGSNPALHLRRYYDMADIIGLTKEQYRTDITTSGAWDSAPTKQVYLHIFTGSMTGALNCVGTLAWRIRFHIEFFEPVNYLMTT